MIEESLKAPEQEAEPNPSELSLQVRTLKLLLEEQQRAAMEMARQATLESIRATEEYQKELEKSRAEAEKARAEAEKIRQQAAFAAQQAAGEVRRVEAEFSNSRRWFQNPSAAPPPARSSETEVSSFSQIEGQDEGATAKKPKESAFRGPKFVLQIVALSLMCGAIASLSITSMSKQTQNTATHRRSGGKRDAIRKGNRTIIHRRGVGA